MSPEYLEQVVVYIGTGITEGVSYKQQKAAGEGDIDSDMQSAVKNIAGTQLPLP